MNALVISPSPYELWISILAEVLLALWGEMTYIIYEHIHCVEKRQKVRVKACNTELAEYLKKS